MKVTYYGIVAMAFLATTFAYPSAKNSDDDVELIKPTYGNDQPIVDTGILDTGSFGNPFDGFLETFTGLMTRMREQMDHFFRSPGVEGGSFNLPNFSNIDLSKGNSTSVTKIIDGHKVIINETDYKQEGDFGGTFFKVRIIDVQPNKNETGETTELDSTENEIHNSISKESAVPEKIKTMDKNCDCIKSGLCHEHQEKNDEPIIDFNDNSFEIRDMVGNNGNEIETFDEKTHSNEPLHYIGNDIDVNQKLAESSFPPFNPDAEVFSDKEIKVGTSQPRFG